MVVVSISSVFLTMKQNHISITQSQASSQTEDVNTFRTAPSWVASPIQTRPPPPPPPPQAATTKFKFTTTLTQCWGGDTKGDKMPTAKAIIRATTQRMTTQRMTTQRMTPVRAHLRRKEIKKNMDKKNLRGSKYENESEDDYASRKLAAALQVRENMLLMNTCRKAMITKKK
jgi:hypothetical protein